MLPLTSFSVNILSVLLRHANQARGSSSLETLKYLTPLVNIQADRVEPTLVLQFLYMYPIRKIDGLLPID